MAALLLRVPVLPTDVLRAGRVRFVLRLHDSSAERFVDCGPGASCATGTAIAAIAAGCSGATGSSRGACRATDAENSVGRSAASRSAAGD